MVNQDQDSPNDSPATSERIENVTGSVAQGGDSDRVANSGDSERVPNSDSAITATPQSQPQFFSPAGHTLDSPLPATSPNPFTSPLPPTSPFEDARKRSRNNTPPSSDPARQRRRMEGDSPVTPARGGVTSSPGNLRPMSSEIDLSSPMTYATSPGSVRTPRSGATPHRRRADITDAGARVQVALPTDGSDLGLSTDPGLGLTSEAGGGARVVIWGTDVVVAETQEQFRRFLCEYAEEEDGEPFYIQRLEEITMSEEPYLTVSCAHVQQFCAELYRQLIQSHKR